MFDKLKKLFGKGSKKREVSEAEMNQFHDSKQKALEAILGPMHDMVGHAVIPYFVGGPLDMYYFANGIPGTGMASMELLEADGTGPKPGKIGPYEVVAFTKHSIKDICGSDQKHPAQITVNRLRSIMTSIGRYSTEVVLNPRETCEIPIAEDEPNACIVLDSYHGKLPGLMIEGRQYGLLLCMEVFPEEMDYARKNGSEHLFKELRAHGHYPYSDLNRAPVV